MMILFVHGLGSPTVIADAAGDKVENVYDAFGRTTRLSAFDGTGYNAVKVSELNYS